MQQLGVHMIQAHSAQVDHRRYAKFALECGVQPADAHASDARHVLRGQSLFEIALHVVKHRRDRDAGRASRAAGQHLGVRVACRQQHLSHDVSLERGYYQGLIAARAAALRRLALECDALGGSGVVGLRVLPPMSRDAAWLDLVVVGTAVRHESGASSSPFVTTLDAADVAALHRTGWCPNGVVFEQARFFAHAGYGMPIGVGMRRYRDPSQAIGPATDVLAFAQSEVRDRLAQRVRQRRGAGMLTQQFDSSWDDHQCSMAPTQSDVTADVVAVGNVIARRDGAVRDRRVDADAMVPLTGVREG